MKENIVPNKMTGRALEIYKAAFDAVDEVFVEDAKQTLKEKSNDAFNRLSKKVQRHLITTGQITAEDTSEFFVTLIDIVNRGVNDCLYMLQMINEE